MPVTFDFTGSNGGNLGTSESFPEVSGISLTVFGYDQVNPDNSTANPTHAAHIYEVTSGLGIDDPNNNGNNAEGTRLGRMDALTFSFSPNVLLLSSLMLSPAVMMRSLPSTISLATRWISGNAAENGNFIVPGGTSAGETHLIDLSSYNLVGPSFTIVGVTCSPCQQSPNELNRGIYIAAISVEAVPIPGALPLLASGLGGLVS